jgi:isochorismate synthase
MWQALDKADFFFWGRETALITSGARWRVLIPPSGNPGPAAVAAQLRRASSAVTELFETASLVARSIGEKASGSVPPRPPDPENSGVDDSELDHKSETRTSPTVAIGIVGFDASVPAEFVVPRFTTVLEGASIRLSLESQDPDTRQSAALLEAPHFFSTCRSTYRRAVTEILKRIENGRLQKAVLARKVDVELTARPTTSEILRRLALQGKPAALFCSKGWIGASPELLVRTEGGEVEVEVVAGTYPAEGSLLQSTAGASEDIRTDSKELHEHRLVVEHVLERLPSLCAGVVSEVEPSVVRVGRLAHLRTVVRGRLKEGVTSLAVAAALHPTPAVCGSPVGPAYESIRELEPFMRRYYSGLVGWCDSDGRSEWAYVLRCAFIAGRRASVFAGAGIVAGSDPDKETYETEAKMKPMLEALGVTER